MSSSIVLLFVAWQDLHSRRFYPVGRLAESPDPYSDTIYECFYSEGALEAAAVGFVPFASFPVWDQRYLSSVLFPMFDNRVLSSRRRDYPEFLRLIGLDSTPVGAMQILSRSGGRRATDTLELFPQPERTPDSGYRTWFWSHGIRHLPVSPEERIRLLQPGERLELRTDVCNPVVKDALQIWTSDEVCVGYMPSYLMDEVRHLGEYSAQCEIYVDRINPEPSPIQQRLLLRMESGWPDGFTPYGYRRYQPIPIGAVNITEKAVRLKV